MPLPDAKPSTRIYELLKTTDLENITFSQFQGVAEKIFAEQGAEDELRRIVLVNLARLSVAGEWTGLTTAATGGSKYAANPLIKAPDQATDNAYFPLNLSGYFLQGNIQIESWNTTDTTTIQFIQALAPKAGTLDELAFRTGSVAGDTLYFAIYACDDDNMPTGDPIFTFDTGTTTTNTQYEPTISLTVTEGQPLWIATFGQTNRTRIWSTYTGSTSVRAWPMVPRLTLSTINYSNDQNILQLSGQTNGVWPTLSSATEFDSSLVSYHFKASIHITE